MRFPEGARVAYCHEVVTVIEDEGGAWVLIRDARGDRSHVQRHLIRETRTPQEARAYLFARLMAHPPTATQAFRCVVCGDRVRGDAVTIDEAGATTCRDCTGRGAP